MAVPAPAIETKIGAIADPRERLLAFAVEREAIRLRRSAGQPKPWTDDIILRSYRFCNIRREDDAVTQWIRVNWREPYAGDEDLWFGMVVARFVNWPETLAEIGWPVPWEPERFLRVMARRKEYGELCFGPAYIVSTNGRKMSKAEYVTVEVLQPLWQGRERLRPKPGDSLNSYHMLLGQMQGLGSFMAAQVIADCKYVEPLRKAVDWYTFAASGPGSRRGLNRILNRPKDAAWREDEWRLQLRRLQDWINSKWLHEPFHGQDCQSLNCEFDKYERVRLGEGRPKRLFEGNGQA
jgi:hypothetical protein